LAGGELLFEYEGLGLPSQALVARQNVLKDRVSDNQSLIKLFNLIL